MPIAGSASELGATVSSAVVGQAFVGALASGPCDGVPVVLGPPGTPLGALLARFEPPRTLAVPVTARIAPDGALVLAGEGLGPAALLHLAAWVTDAAPATSSLASLCGARIASTRRGRIADTLASDVAWAEVPRGAAPFGSLSHAERVIAGIAPGKPVWMWLCDGPPHVALSPAADDRDCSRIAAVSATFGRPGHDAVLRVATTGELTLTSRSAVDAVDAARAALLDAVADRYPGLRRLAAARLFQASGEAIVGHLAPATLPSDASGASAVLAADPPRAYFWFTPSGRDGLPTLQLATDRADIEAAARAHRGVGPEVRGLLIPHLDALAFAVQTAPPAGFLHDIARWVGANRAAWPALSRLEGATVAVRGPHGIAETLRAPDAWRRLRRGDPIA